MWLVTLAGVFLLYTQLVTPNRPGVRTLTGGILVGFGAFNVVDEIVMHVLFELHHIRPGPDYLLYDLGYTAFGVAMVAIGGWLIRREAPGAVAPL
jgi:uncharacterized membrane protein